MKKLLLVANWKSNKSTQEANFWAEQMANSPHGESGGKWQSKEKTVILCPPFTLLSFFKSYFLQHNSALQLGAQDVSPFPKGAYTGELAADQLKEFVTYVIIGHSERRKYFHEDDQMLANKVDMVLDSGIKPIFCVQDEYAIVPKGVKVVAYEPMFAIGTGEPDIPENAEKVAKKIKEDNREVQFVLYGGSVTEKNVHLFTQMLDIDGVLVGSASLDPISFFNIVVQA